MKVSVTGIPLSELDVDLLMVPLSEDAPEPILDGLHTTLGETFTRARVDFTGRVDSNVVFYPAQSRARRVVLLGTGPSSGIDAETLRRAAAEGARVAASTRAATVALLVPDLSLDAETTSQALVEGFLMASYRFNRYKTGEPDQYLGPDRLVLHARQDESVSRRGAERARILAEAVATARDLVNLSPDEKSPTQLSRLIEKSAKKYGYVADVWNRALIEEEKMGGLLAVNRGSIDPPTFTILSWQHDNAVNERPLILVGKGVVFDTGGLSLKRTKDGMDKMKSDMAGAAAVVGAFEAVARLDLPLNLIGLIPATDNRPGENAYVPGEVVRMHSGATVEVLNTDAEGRMILADALSYATTYKPELVIDLATLTGAAGVALGSDCAAVMTPDSDGASERLEAIEAAGRRSGDRVHRLPMFDEYARALESDVADMKNIGGGEAGTIIGAKFLERFVSYPWIHIDIAATAFLDTPKPYRPKGASGFGVRLLVEFLRDYVSQKRRR